jgi:hypothetical protein
MIAAKGLRADGVLSETKRPQILSAQDAARALRIVAFCPVPSKYSRIAPIETWSDVPAPSDYAAAREVILSHRRQLLRQLKADTNKRSLGLDLERVRTNEILPILAGLDLVLSPIPDESAIDFYNYYSVRLNTIPKSVLTKPDLL